MERKHFLDNIRWVTVLLVLFYHVIYFYNAKGVFGGIGGFYEDQPWDAIMSVLYPWFMMLLFVVAGISSRYSLSSNPLSSGEANTHRRFIKDRTRKLLVPATIGLLVFQWMTGYFNTQVAGVDVLTSVPQPVKHFLRAFSGIGPLWFIQDLWLFSLLLVLIRVIEKDKLFNSIGRLFQEPSIGKTIALVVIGYLLIWAGAQCSISHPDPESADGLWNLYRPFAYLVPFLMGYFVFAHDTVQEMIANIKIPMLILAIVTGTIFTIVMYGKNDTDPIVLQGWLCNLYAWFAILAMLGCFKAWANKTSPFATYMTRSSYGIYIVHYLVIASFGYMMKRYTTMAPWMMYVILFVAVMLLSPAIYEILKRIPFVRWCVLGIKKK
jgi:peptidoglycan/LPS O-acetylase OafA/YrhL